MRKIAQRMFAILLLLLPLCSLELSAQIEGGNVYNLVSQANRQSLSAPSLEVITTQATNTGSYAQLWYAETAVDNSGRFALRNLSNGRYLRSSKKASGPWTLVTEKDENCYFYSVSADGAYVINSTNDMNGYTCMHFDTGQGRVVCWAYENADKSKWNITPVTFSEVELQNNWANLDIIQNVSANKAIYQEALNALFVDKACTQLRNLNVDASDPDYQRLSPELQKMVDKVKSGNWAEKNADSAKPEWESAYAKKFRVQLYEPYCDPREAAKAIKINAHANLNNPTGLYANERQVLYVMVDGSIQAGAELYLGSYVGHGMPNSDFRSGTRLQEGLNIIPYWSDGNALYVNYVVETFKDGKMTQHKLSQFPDLKIHIEGGHINGYYNVVGDKLYQPDRDVDWNYYEERANLDDITILGKYQALQFYLHAIGNDQGLSHYFTEHASVEAVMKEWDRIMMSERLTLGLLSEQEIKEANRQYPTLDDPSRGIYAYIGKDKGFVDYSDAYRLHGLSLGTTQGYMYGSWEYSGYNINTFGDIIGNIAKAAGPTWGPAHEIGHQHQLLLNMNGLTEVSNNVFSNVAVWYNGRSTSRINVDGGDLMSILNVFNQENTDFFTNDRWALTQMNYKMWLYYHLAGHNNKFYPRLFEILRNDPMKISATQDGATSLLHLYKKCCLAAGEDLTDFFRAYGVFRPMDNRFVDDYTKSHYNMTQAQIDAAIKEVKSLNLPENHVLMLINDATADKTYGHDGTTPRELWSGVCSELGNYIKFYVGKESKVTVPYTCQMDGSTIRMSGGQGGVGFLIYSNDGELLGFSDHYNFPVSARAQMSLAKGRAKLYVANGDNTMVEVKIQNAEENEKKMLTDLLLQVDNIFKMEDASGTLVGFYHPEALDGLKTVRDEAKRVADAGVAGTYLSAYELLNDELVKLQNNEYAKIGIVAGSAYALLNRQYADYWMSVDNSKNMKAVTENTKNETKWYFESAGGDGVYALKSKSVGTYVKDAKRSTQLKADANAEGKVSYKLQNMGDGYFALVCQDHEGLALHCDASKNIVGWDVSAPASQWRVQAVELSETDAAKVSLSNLINQTNELIGKMAVVTNTVTLQTKDANASGYLYCNAPYTGDNADKSTPENGYGLLDNDINTYLHTDYSGADSQDGLDHYLCVDFGEGKSYKEFVFSYETRNATSLEKPKTIKVEGSNDNKTYNEVTTLNNLPNEKAKLFSQKINSATPYRYWRFMVTETYKEDPKGGHAYFSMASFGIGFGKDVISEVNSKYFDSRSGIESALVAVTEAKSVLTISQDVVAIREAISSLQTAYQNLCKAYDTTNNAGLVQKKDELQNLMTQVESLVNECGAIGGEGNVVLQTTNAAGAGYLSSNADQNDCGDATKYDGGGIAALIDSNLGTYFHTRWGGDVVNAPHFIQVDLGQDVKTTSFQFSYATRQAPSDATSPAPTKMKVQGSNNGIDFFDIALLTKEANLLPTYDQSGKQWTSQVLKSDKAYRYLRVVVTESAGPGENQYGGQYFFAMSEFSLNLIPNLILNDKYVEVTEEQWLKAYHGLAAARTVMDLAKTEVQVAAAIAELQEKYEMLLASKNASAAYDLKVSEYGYAGLFLKRNAAIPSGATAYVVSQVNPSSVTLTRISDGVVPANVGVIVEATEGVHTFQYTDHPATASSLLKGVATTTFIKGETGMSYYLFGVKNGKVGLYKAWLEYNADGLQSEEMNDTDLGGYFRVSAHKVYLPESRIKTSALSFIFNDLTGIEKVEGNSEDMVIYDLQGRRVNKVQKSGLYIVNGQKRFVKI